LDYNQGTLIFSLTVVTMTLKTISSFCLSIFALVCLTSFGISQEVTSDVIAEGLNRPGGIAIHPADQTLFVAEYGAKRVVKIVDGKTAEIAVGFPEHSHNWMKAAGGPVSLDFLNPNWILVGTTAEKEKPMQIRGFDLSKIVDDKPLEFDAAPAILEIGSDEAKLEGQVNGVLATESSVFIAGERAEQKSFIARVAQSAAAPETIELMIPENEDSEEWLGSPRAMAVSVPEGYLALIQQSDSGSKLCFYSTEGEANGDFETGLKNVVAMAYGPNRGRLYLADRETQAIYKLIESDNDAGCESVKVHELPNVTDMQFNADGELLVSTLGETVGDDSGQIIKLIGLDVKKDEAKEGE
jgi:hypothetical protein